MPNNEKNDESFVSFLLRDIIGQSLKRIASDVVRVTFDSIRGAIDSYLFQENTSYLPPSSSSYNDYGSYYSKSNSRGRSPSNQNLFGLNELYFNTIIEAKDAKHKAANQIQNYGSISVAVFYDMCTDIVAPSTANNYGWTDADAIMRSRIIASGRRYILVLPDPEPLR